MTSSIFNAVVKIRGINPFIRISAARARALKPGWRKPLPVLIRINGKPVDPWRTNMMPAGNGSFYLYLNGVVRAEAGVSIGDLIHMEIEFDASYRNGPQHSMPQWFGEAVKKDPETWKNWSALVPSRKKEVLRYLAQLKSPEARASNLAKALHVLSGQTGRFMARTWRNGS